MPLESVATVATPSTVPVGTKIAVDTMLTTLEQVQIVKLADGTVNSEVMVQAPAGALYVDVRALPAGGITIQDGGNSITVDGVFWPATPATDVGTVRIKDSLGGSIGLGQKTMAQSLPVVMASDQGALAVSGTLTGITGVVHVDDNTGSLTVDNAGTFAVQITGAPTAGGMLPVSLATVPSHAVTVTSGSLTADTELAPAAAFGDGLTAANLGTNVPAVQAVGVGFDGTNYDRVRVANAGTQIAGGTAGVLVVQGTGAAGAIPITGSVTAGGMQDNGAFVDNSSLVSPAGFIFDETAGTALTENDVAAGRIDSKRAQIMVIEDATTRGAARRAQVTTNGELIIAGSGVAGTPTGTQALTVQGIGGMFPLDVAEKGTWVMPDDAAFAVASSRVAMSGFLADEVATDSVDEGDGGAARMTLDRRQIVVPTAHTQGGSSPFYNLDVDETEDAIKATAGQLYELYLNNTTNAQLYVKLYDGTVASVVVGTTTPAMVIPVPGNNDLDGAGVVRQWVTGLAFATAITIAATTGAADNDTGAPSTGALIASGAYK